MMDPVFWHDYKVVVAAGASAGIGLEALPPVRKAIGSGFETKTITLSCGNLTTGVTVAQWSSILMLRNLKSPETYFQAAEIHTSVRAAIEFYSGHLEPAAIGAPFTRCTPYRNAGLLAAFAFHAATCHI
jgi:hypothetical protein